MRATVMYGRQDVRVKNVPDAGLVEQTDALSSRSLMHQCPSGEPHRLDPEKLAPTSWLGQLPEAEYADRQARSFQYQEAQLTPQPLVTPGRRSLVKVGSLLTGN